MAVRTANDPTAMLPTTLSRRDLAFDALQQLIVSGALAPGERLIEEALGLRLGMSRNPVREALKLLELEGFVTILPYRGAVVSRLGRTEALDVFELRSNLDAFAARLAAERATPAHASDLKEILDVGDDALGRREFGGLGRLNSDFHEQIYRIANNAELQRAVGNLRLKVQWMFAGYAASRGAEAWTEHRTIHGAIAAGDEDAAANWSSLHVAQSRDAFLSLLDG